MANTGCLESARPLVERFLSTFEPFDYIVAPSGSCVAMVRHHFAQVIDESPTSTKVTSTTYELAEFLVNVLNVSHWNGACPRRVGVHQACHGLRELRLGQPSEVVAPPFNKINKLLDRLEGIELAEFSRADECCGFGGTFAVSEEAVSTQMGRDRLTDHGAAGVEIVVSADMSCLMHLNGLATRQRLQMKFMHLAEVLARFGTGPNFG